MEHGREQFAGHLVHIRDHEQQALRGGVRRGQGAGIQRTVDSAGCAGLCLHFLHSWNGPLSLLRPTIPFTPKQLVAASPARLVNTSLVMLMVPFDCSILTM